MKFVSSLLSLLLDMVELYLVYGSKTTFTKLIDGWEVIGGLDYCS